MIAYICGSYSAPTINEIAENIYKARAVARKYWKQGYAVICPHTNSAFMDGDNIDFYAGDLEILSKCDAIVMMNGWEKSQGSKRELEFAKEHNLTIFYDDAKKTKRIKEGH
jgi:dienelactone hydrolase